LTLKDPPQFFPDLLDRLKLGDVVLLPPLRDRLEDLPELVGGFVAQAEDEVTGAYHGRAVDRSVYELLASYDWPGNIRELGACIKSAVNTYKHMERLVPRCIELPGAPTSSARHHLRTPHAQTKEPGSPSESGAANHPAFSPLRPQELAGRLSEIQSRHAEEMAAYVDAILQATSRPSLDCLEGEILLHPAAKLMTGDRSLSASEGADLFKRLLRPLERIGEGKYLTPRLHLALLRAIQIRPSRQKDEQN
jgi:hypothetical protein